MIQGISQGSETQREIGKAAEGKKVLWTSDALLCREHTHTHKHSLLVFLSVCCPLMSSLFLCSYWKLKMTQNDTSFEFTCRSVCPQTKSCMFLFVCVSVCICVCVPCLCKPTCVCCHPVRLSKIIDLVILLLDSTNCSPLKKPCLSVLGIV